MALMVCWQQISLATRLGNLIGCEMTVRVLARKKSLRKGGKRAGSRVAYMFDMAEAERPDFRCARIDPSRPLRQYVGGAA